MTATRTPRDGRGDGSILGEGRLSMVRLYQDEKMRLAAAERTAGAARRGRSLRSRVGRIVVMTGLRIAGSAAEIGGAASAGPAGHRGVGTAARRA